MYIAERIRYFREQKHLSQGDLENRTGLKRSYISQVEHGHFAPSIENLERIAAGLEVPLYQLLYNGKEVAPLPTNGHNHEPDWASHGKGKRLFERLCRAVSQLSEKDRQTLLFTAGKLAANVRH